MSAFLTQKKFIRRPSFGRCTALLAISAGVMAFTLAPVASGSALTDTPEIKAFTKANLSRFAATQPAPRTFVTAQNLERLREYCLTGEGAQAFARFKREFDAKYLSGALPEEPQPRAKGRFPVDKSTEAALHWRDSQRTTATATGIAEAAFLLWKVTGEQRYLDRAKEAFLSMVNWNPVGAAGIVYNDEAAFRYWRKMPFLFDQLRDHLSDAQKREILSAFSAWGDSVYDVVAPRVIQNYRNSVEGNPNSHAIRFVSMLGISGLALLDDLPQARGWLDFAYNWYDERFPTWGGHDGGWGEGTRYWETGVFSEPARFQDALTMLGSESAWSNPFWAQTGYFVGYLFQPYANSQFGDAPGGGKTFINAKAKRMLHRLSREFDDGYLRLFADRASPDTALTSLDLNNFPSGVEMLLADFASSRNPLPEAKDLGELPPSRWFKDIGWVTMHSDMVNADEDIHLTFVSSPYGSFSHSHAAQNGFTLSAYGQNLAINAGFREWHDSPHHNLYTRRTLSKNALLIGGEGQTPRSALATGEILYLKETDNAVWTGADATKAYNAGRSTPLVSLVRRDIVFVDKRYFVIRDQVETPRPQAIQWLLHTEAPIQWLPQVQRMSSTRNGVTLQVLLHSTSGAMSAQISDEFPTPLQAGYAERHRLETQYHFSATAAAARQNAVIAVLWPDKTAESVPTLKVEGNAIVVTRPDGTVDRINLDTFSLSSQLKR